LGSVILRGIFPLQSIFDLYLHSKLSELFMHPISSPCGFRSSFAPSLLASAPQFPSAMTVNRQHVDYDKSSSRVSGKFHATPDVSYAGQTLLGPVTSTINFPFAQYLTKCVHARLRPCQRLTTSQLLQQAVTNRASGAALARRLRAAAVCLAGHARLNSTPAANRTVI
jgi:hypothetical protein